ncbi:MAG TPA: hypothetical protein PKA64_19300, partial [Myxococcota bacterium]|nr:hypothetical protein [Myxococcota bacterium]
MPPPEGAAITKRQPDALGLWVVIVMRRKASWQGRHYACAPRAADAAACGASGSNPWLARG